MSQKTAVITAASFVNRDASYYAYAPYIKEMEIWARNADEIAFACPILEQPNDTLLSELRFRVAQTFVLQQFDVKSFKGLLSAIFHFPKNIYVIYRAMAWADHIHLRCPGNIGLLGCLVQIAFPRKQKSAKYAGNWDPGSKQPISYRLQKWLLNNTFLTRNMQVLVYGEWNGMSHNIKPFFTASYSDANAIEIQPRKLTVPLKFLFVGTLSPGKRPLYAVELFAELNRSGISGSLELFGEGPERIAIEKYIKENELQNSVKLMGNRSEAELRAAYQSAHFMILPSKSEGWPKAVAEAMFWGCVPLVSDVSCVTEMIGHEKRGLLLELDLEKDSAAVEALLSNNTRYNDMANQARDWSQLYTTERFENEIKKILKC